ncbi:uncharacterized protein RG961_004661 [Leptosomus discolor]
MAGAAGMGHGGAGWPRLFLRHAGNGDAVLRWASTIADWLSLGQSRPAGSVTSAFLPATPGTSLPVSCTLQCTARQCESRQERRSLSVAGLGLRLHRGSGSRVFLIVYPHRQMLWGYGSSALHPPAGQYAETGMSCEGAVSARRQLTRAAECQLAPFNCGDPFFCPGGTRLVERIPSGLQGQDLLTERDVQQQRWWRKGCSCCAPHGCVFILRTRCPSVDCRAVPGKGAALRTWLPVPPWGCC